MELQADEVRMVRWECHACGMAATCVLTDTAELAWQDHLSTHADAAQFSAWTWLVLPLPFPI